MSRTCNLETQTTKVNIVIDEPFKNNIQSVVDDLKKNGYVFALIRHDKDLKPDLKTLKTPHYHLILRAPKRHRLKYYLTMIADLFDKVNTKGVSTTDSIEVGCSESFEWDLQYLVHKNDRDKYQYDSKDIITNLTENQVNDMLSIEVHKEVSSEYLIALVCDCKDEIELMKRLGLSYFTLHTKAISLLISKGYLGYNIRNGIVDPQFDCYHVKVKENENK